MKKFRNITANIVIALTLFALLAVTTGSGRGISVFGEKPSPIYSGDKTGDKISLMINVYWGTEYVLPMAELMEKYGFRCTFFVGGSWADDNVGLVRTLSERGFEIGNHGYFHKDHSKLTYDQNFDEIVMNQRLIDEIVGYKGNYLFAPPSGAFNDDTLAFCRKNGFTTVMWTRDTIDWRDKDPDLVYRRAVKNMAAGDLVLMHPTAHTLKALPKILAEVAAKGMRVVTVSENLGL